MVKYFIIEINNCSFTETLKIEMIFYRQIQFKMYPNKTQFILINIHFTMNLKLIKKNKILLATEKSHKLKLLILPYLFLSKLIKKF